MKTPKKWAREVIDLYGERCTFCYNQSAFPHHFFHRSQYPGLSNNPKNGVPICQDHHNQIHGEKRKQLEESIIITRGIDWHEELRNQLPKQIRPPKHYEKI